jgi:hypothetical protein
MMNDEKLHKSMTFHLSGRKQSSVCQTVEENAPSIINKTGFAQPHDNLMRYGKHTDVETDDINTQCSHGTRRKRWQRVRL